MSSTQIYKATYSSVPVYEMPCQGVAVMRRKLDGWLNATQILKVAGFDKPQRTRVLEREVQKGTHEKVQGGYGKYQGTWVPMDRGIALSQQYGVDALLQPIFDFVPTLDSPPLAPKHITAPAMRPSKKRDAAAAAAAMAAGGAEGNDSGASASGSTTAREGKQQTKASIAAGNKLIKAAAKAARIAAASAGASTSSAAASSSTTTTAAKKRKAAAAAAAIASASAAAHAMMMNQRNGGGSLDLEDGDVPAMDSSTMGGRKSGNGGGGAAGERESEERSLLSPTPSEASSSSDTPSPLGSEVAATSTTTTSARRRRGVGQDVGMGEVDELDEEVEEGMREGDEGDQEDEEEEEEEGGRRSGGNDEDYPATKKRRKLNANAGAAYDSQQQHQHGHQQHQLQQHQQHQQQQQQQQHNYHSQQQQQQHHHQSQQSQVRHQQQQSQQQDQQQQQYPPSAHPQPGSGPLLYARMILDYFVSESTQVPPFLISPPADFDANVVIDDDGHTALHWACAMGRIRIVKLLLTAGADIFRANTIGQTALMRSVMFTNNYDLRKFPELFELLHRSTINIDRQDRTVFHYIVDIALQKGKTHAARYYLETVLSRLVDYPQEVADILNFQDEEGETALTLAARARSKRIVKILLDNGADPKIVNRDGKNAEDYILEDERFRENDDKGFQNGLIAVGASTMPTAPSSAAAAAAGSRSSASNSVQQQYQQPIASTSTASTSSAAVSSSASLLFAPQLHTSTSGQLASHTCIPQMATLLESLATSYDAELSSTQADLHQASTLLANLQAEIVESKRVVDGLRRSAEQLEALGTREDELVHKVGEKMGRRFRFGWEKWVRQEENRQSDYMTALLGSTTASSAAGGTATTTAVEGESTEDASTTTTAPIPQPDLDLLAAMHSLPEAELRARAQVTQASIAALTKQRKELFETLIGLQGEVGTGGKMREYKMLIALGCGVPLEEVDGVLEELCETLESGAM